MANYLVDPQNMLNPHKIEKLNNWHRLNTNTWADDTALIEKLEKETRHGNYFVTDKSFKKLWDLLTYCGHEDAAIIAQYYGFPTEIVAFLRWTYNMVATKDESWKWEVELKPDQNTYEDRLPQNDWFPYEHLYMIYFRLRHPNSSN